MNGKVTYGMMLADAAFDRRTMITSGADSVTVSYKCEPHRAVDLEHMPPAERLAALIGAYGGAGQTIGDGTDQIPHTGKAELLQLLHATQALTVRFSADRQSAAASLTFGGLSR